MLIEHDVGQINVPVNDLFMVEVLSYSSNLMHEFVNFILFKIPGLALLKASLELTSLIKVHDQKQQLIPLPNVNNFGDVRVIQLFQEATLIDKFFVQVQINIDNTFYGNFFESNAISSLINNTDRALAYSSVKMVMVLYVALLDLQKHLLVYDELVMNLPLKVN